MKRELVYDQDYFSAKQRVGGKSRAVKVLFLLSAGLSFTFSFAFQPACIPMQNILNLLLGLHPLVLQMVT